MGAWAALEAFAETPEATLAAVEAAYLEIARIERQLHPNRQGSELQSIHTAPLHTPVPIGAATWELLQLAQSVYALSEGIFDPCLPYLPGRLSDLVLSGAGAKPHWALCRVPLALDLGGIAKGYAIDRAIEALRLAGCASGVVNVGGDLRIFGRSDTVLLRYSTGNCVPLTLKDEALAVSDLDAHAQRRPPEHQGYYRRSGKVRTARRYAAVVAARAAIADALTKCVLLAGERLATRTLRALGARRVA
jgi:thiamine biosynthesis lipoprotein